MSAGIRARRVADPLAVQRGPYPQHAQHDQSLTGIANAWDNIAEAKKVLQNAEARLEDAEFHRAPSMTPMSQDVHRSPPRRYLSDYSHDGLSEYNHQASSRVPVDVVPSIKIGNNKVSRHEKGKTRKKVTIVDVATPRDKYNHHSSHSSPHRSSLATMNNYQPRAHQPSHKQYNDPQLQRIENRMMMDNRGAPRGIVDGFGGGARPPLYEDTLLRTQLREQERRAALLRTLSRPTDYNRPSSFSPPRGVGGSNQEQQATAHRLSPSSHEILDNGPTNLSIDNSTEIRVLNDIPLPQPHENNAAASSKHRLATKPRIQNNYVSAYERLYGSQPGDNLYNSEQSSQESLPTAGVSSHKRTMGSEHLERLREKIEQQKSSLSVSDPSARIRHRDTDPILVATGEGEHRTLAVESSPGRAPVRKVASAPPAPVYKGFNEVETRFRMPDGSIVSQDLAGKKTTTRKRSSKSARDKVHNNLNSAKDRTLQPSRAQPQHKANAQTSRSNTTTRGSKPIRKVQKITEPNKRPKKPERTGIISTTSWRDGQKAVLKVLGPAPKPQKPTPHSPPTRDTVTSESTGDIGGKASPEPMSEEEELSQHPMESEREASDDDLPNVDNLPSDAKDMLKDLQLDNDSDSVADEMVETVGFGLGNDTTKEQKQISSMKTSRKKKGTQGSRKESEILPAKRVRHYNANDVQKYISKQRADRKKKLQDDKIQRKQAEERKKEQLQELFRRQKESAKSSQKSGKDGNKQRLDETFSKEPGTSSITQDPPALRQRPVQTNFNKRLDVTSSDKENKGVWSTSSSSDSSLRSSPQTEGSNDMPLHMAALGERSEESNQEGGPMEVVLTRITTTDSGRPTGDHRERNVPDTIVEEELMDMTPVEKPALLERPQGAPRSVHDAWTQPQPYHTNNKTKPRSKAERLQALKATASALQGKIENEVRKLTSDPSSSLRSPEQQPMDVHADDDKWAYPPPIDMIVRTPSVDKPNKRVRFPVDEEQDLLPGSRYERLVGNGRDYHVFTGSLPGVGSLSEQAKVGRDQGHQGDAATKIQAAYRGHSVRQKLDWTLPSGSTLKDKIKGNVPQIHVSSVSEALSSPRTSPYSSGGEAGDSEGESLSEGPMSDDEGSIVENMNYIPKFKHKTNPAKPNQRHQRSPAPFTAASVGLNNMASVPVGGGISSAGTRGGLASWDRSVNDGLSVINIYTKKYQETNRGRVYHGKLPATASALNNKSKSPISGGYSYDDDFSHKTTSSHYQSSSATSPAAGISPDKDLTSDDMGEHTESISYGEEDFTGSGMSKSDAKASYSGPGSSIHRTGKSSASSPSQHLSMPSSKQGRRSPLGGASDVNQVKSDADRTLNSYKSDEFESTSSDEEPTPRKRRTPSPRSRRARTSSKSPLTNSQRSSPSSKSASSQSPTSDFRKSPPRISPSLMRSGAQRSPHSRSKSPRSQSLHSPAPKSPVTKEVLSHFRPIPSSSEEGGMRDRRQEGMGVERPQPRAATAQTVPSIPSLTSNPTETYYSPGALELKMAAELNLLESLEVSVRQLTDFERTRAISLAQQESVSLARILQSRQKDHERELQLLSLKARQEVQDANKQLEQVKQRAVTTASEAERALVQVRKEASDANTETARRLIESQTEAARVTAEAARQLAEARSAAAAAALAAASQPAPAPSFDTGKMATDTATAAASAAVTAVMEQQRQHQIEMWQEMRNAAVIPQPIGASTRNFGVGDFAAVSASSSHPVDSTGDYSSSFTSPSKTPSGVPSYTDDFTNSATPSSSSKDRSPKSASMSTMASKSVATAIDESQDSVPAKRPNSLDSIKTTSDLSVGSTQKSDASIPTQSGVSVERDAHRKSDNSSGSIPTESGADPAMSTGSISMAEDLPDDSIKSTDYSISFNGSESDISKLSDVSSDKSSVISSVISTRNLSKDEDKTPRNLPMGGRTGGDDSFSRLSSEMLRQQLRDEEVRAQQQAALFKLREKALTEKTRANLQLLEHEKRRMKEKGDEDGLQAIKRQQKLLLTKLQQEQVEIRRLKTAQRAASRERQLLLFQQQEVSRMRKEAQDVKGRMKDLPDVSLSSSVECLASEDDVSMDSFDGTAAAKLPQVLSDSNASSMTQRLYDVESERQTLGSGMVPRPMSSAEKQAQVMKKLKKLQQPISLKHLTKREQKLMRRRKNVEDLLAWKQRLDEEEKRINNLEEDALHTVQGPNAAGHNESKKESRANSEVDLASRATPSEHHSDDETSRTENTTSHTISSVSESKSGQSEKRSPRLSDFGGHSSIRDSESSIAEDLSQNSSVPEELPSVKSQPKISTSLPITEASSDDTLKNDSPKDEYATESFESADRTITPTRSSTPISTKTLTSTQDSASVRSVLSQRKRHESESGSESERSFSQTMSEPASDQSDIEGRVRALKDALRKRKIEAERLRKQQKRMNREKLKAQEASLKKQLEAYDQLILKTKAELRAESDHTTLSTVKPKIKQPRVSESQRLRDQSHTKSLRQRAASETSRGESGMPDVALRKQRSGSEGSVSSRSSFDEDAGGQSRDGYTPVSSVSTPPTTPRHAEDGVSPVHKTPSPLHRSMSSNSSAQLPSDRETPQKTPSPLRSQQSVDEDKSRPQSASSISSDIPEYVESASSVSVTPDISMKEVVMEKPSGQSDIDTVSPRGKPAVAAQVSVDELTAKSESSDVPEDIVSVASSYTSDQDKSSLRLAQDKKDTLDDTHTKSSLSEKSAPVSEIGEDLSFSYSGSAKSLSRHSRPRSEKSDVSYSDDFFESSVSIDVHNHDTKSETDDDISEHLSMASEPSDRSSGQSQERLSHKSKTPEMAAGIEEDVEEQVPSVTVSIAEDVVEDEEKSEVAKHNDVKSQDDIEEPIQDLLAEFNVGDRVLVGGVKIGTLRFKGTTHFANGVWGGVELDEPHGSNNGTYGEQTYFACKPDYGIFAPPEKLSQLPADNKAASPDSVNESSVAEEISVAEDIHSEASTHTTSKSESVKSGITREQTPRSIKYSEDFENEDVMEEKGIMEEEEVFRPDTSESSISRVSQMKSHSVGNRNAEDTDEDSIAEEISEEAALEKLIHSTALAVESFSKDNETKPAGEEPEAETPRGAPENEEAVTSKEQLVDSITDHLTHLVVKDSVQVVSDIAGQHMHDRNSVLEEAEEEVEENEANEMKQERDKSSGDDKSSGSLLELLAGDETLPEEVSPREEEEVKEVSPVVSPKENKAAEVDNLTRTLLAEAIADMLAIKRKRAEKIMSANQKTKELEEDDYVELKPSNESERTPTDDDLVKEPDNYGMVTPPNQEPPVPRADTPYTPEDSPTHRVDSTSPLSDELFKSRVQVESSPDDQGQVARPGSPVLGESSILNPEALSERLEQLQTLDQDMGDLFGDQEWFDDDFNSMPKSKSIIQVPVRSTEGAAGDSNKDSGENTPAEARRFDLMKFAEEPFYAVPHNRSDVDNLVDKSVQVFYDRVQQGERLTRVSPPPSVMGDDTKASDIESTSKKAYKKLVFDLSGEIYSDIITEQTPIVQSPWMKPKQQPRRYLFDHPPKNRDEIGSAIRGRVLSVTNLDKKLKGESSMNKFGKKKKDHVDEILTQELREEEPEWVDYDEDELSVKMQLSDAIFDSLLVDTAMVLSRIQDKRKARSRPMYDDDDLEF